ncbi:MAG: bifunctional diaminohydroxyphosphoribosylaminopyrimidine deaminase/5-amino-6-(5-phosphoribosylamino)uracil reductase RibD [Thermodesulfobacteriota bacterium]|nr:bifunctional diaminohydroxyphosphoribosylaminopyrimidine deaminase/5-amino-6-(5-phosphoribosylamino)uracil reductase RibD [Thermodesulfobacteriota bacterium]
MKLALKEAAKGVGRTSPNPAVGAVIVKNGHIVGKGYHKRAGTPHAEIHALNAAGDQAKKATLYVTLEPCNHTGRTPPCTNAILKSGIRRVVVGMNDPNPGVAGGGCEFLSAHGLEVTIGVLKDACEKINRPFIKHITAGLPWVIIKAGISLDGRIAAPSGDSGWITNELSRLEVHRIRNKTDAIMIGIGTALSDNPSLTTRLPVKKGRDPLRVILDTHLRLHPDAEMLQQSSNAETWVFCGPDPSEPKALTLKAAGARIKKVGLTPEGHVDIKDVLTELGRSGITSVLVEGGSRIHGALLRSGLADQAFLFVAPLFIGCNGVPLVDELGTKTIKTAQRIRMTRSRRFGEDVLIEGLFDIAHSNA